MLSRLGTKAWSAIAASVVMVGAVIAGVAIASGDDFDPVYGPEWQPGYSFSYDVTAEFDVLSRGIEDFTDGLPPEMAGAIGPIQVKKEVLNTADYRSHGQPLFVSAANFPLSGLTGDGMMDGKGGAATFLVAERQHDLAPLAVMPDWSCRSDDCPSGGVKILADNPLTYLNFPLTEGKRWEQRAPLPLPLPSEWAQELAGITDVRVVGEVGGMESVDLGELGTTRAVRVDFAYRPVGFEGWLQALAKQAEDAGFTVERYNVHIGLHEIVHYSPEFESIVKQQYLLSALFDLKFSGEVYGQTIDEDIYFEFTGVISAVLAGIDTSHPAEQATPIQILQKMGNVDLIQDARGAKASVKTVPYTLSLSAARQEVNAAEAEKLPFTVSVGGVEQLPAGHQLAYTVTDLSGAVVESRAFSGERFHVLFDQPGIYTVSVASTGPDGQRVASSLPRTIEADYKTIVRADCGISPLGSYCQPFAFPVTEGADSLVVESYSRSGTPRLSETLRLQSADGHSHTGGRQIELKADQIRQGGFGDWSVSYSDFGGYLSEVDYVVRVDYKAPSVSSTAPPESSGGPESGGVLHMMGGLVRSVDNSLRGLEQGEVRVDLSPIFR